MFLENILKMLSETSELCQSGVLGAHWFGPAEPHKIQKSAHVYKTTTIMLSSEIK